MLVHQAEDGNIVVEVDRASRSGAREIAIGSEVTRSVIVIARLDDGHTGSPVRVPVSPGTSVRCILQDPASGLPVHLHVSFDGSMVLSLGRGIACGVNGSVIQDVDAQLLAPVRLDLPVGQPLVQIRVSTMDGRVTVDPVSGAILIDRRIVVSHPSALERELMRLLEAHRPRAVPSLTLGDGIWGKGQWDDGMLHNVLWRLRQKLRRGGIDPDTVLVMVRGEGYLLL